MTTEQKNIWAAGNLYDCYMGRLSRLVAEKFIAWLEVQDGFVCTGSDQADTPREIDSSLNPVAAVWQMYHTARTCNINERLDILRASAWVFIRVSQARNQPALQRGDRMLLIPTPAGG